MAAGRGCVRGWARVGVCGMGSVIRLIQMRSMDYTSDHYTRVFVLFDKMTRCILSLSRVRYSPEYVTRMVWKCIKRNMNRYSGESAVEQLETLELCANKFLKEAKIKAEKIKTRKKKHSRQ